MLTTLSRDTPADEILAVLDRDGGVILEGLLSGAQADWLRGDFEPHLGAVEWSNAGGAEPKEFFGLRTKRLHGLLARSSAYGELIADPLLVGLARQRLAGRCRTIRISTGELMALGEGESVQELHRDADSWPFVPAPRPPVLFSANVALTEFTAENGATVVVPGSHHWPKERKPEKSEETQAVMAKGSALLYDGDVIHGGGANRTPGIRIGCYVGYLVSWLRPLEDHHVTTGVEVAEKASPEVQRLLGFSDEGWQVIP
ncbi:MAG: phytanoyl-CoA dioxygenase family protein [bacterium]|nr:phytanoyl-CoA dioxygenase family protein [bacterium]